MLTIVAIASLDHRGVAISASGTARGGDVQSSFSVLEPDHAETRSGSTQVLEVFVHERRDRKGSGHLYLKSKSDSGAIAARKVRLEEWRTTIAVDSWGESVPFAVVLDGEAMRIESFSAEGQIVASATGDILVEVLGVAEMPLDEVTVSSEVRARSVYQDSRRHPGIVYPSQVVANGLGSPVWIKSSEVTASPTDFWFWASSCSYSRVVLQSDSNNYHSLVLGAGGSLEVGIAGAEDTKSLVLVCEAEKGPPDGGRSTLEIGPLFKNTFIVKGLKPGKKKLSIVLAEDPAGNRLFEVDSVVETGVATKVNIRLGQEPAAWKGHLSGEVSFPPNVPPKLFDSGLLRLCIVQVSRADGGRVARGAWNEIRIKDMQSIGTEESVFGWILGDTAPGQYRLEIAPLGYMLDVWVDLGQSSYASLAVPELSLTRLKFSDSVTGLQQEVGLGLVLSGVVGDGALRTSVYHQIKSGTVELICIPSQLSLEVKTKTHGTFWHIMQADPGNHELDVEVAPAWWARLKFTNGSQGGKAYISWYGKIEIWDGAGKRAPLWTESWKTSGGGRTLMLCIPGESVVELRFVPDEGYAHIPSSFVSPGVGKVRELEFDIAGDASMAIYR